MLASVLGLLLLLAIGGVLYWLGIVAWTARTLTHPPRQTYASAVFRRAPGDPGELDSPRQFQAWTLRSQGRDLAVWDLPGDDPNGPVAIVTHGWASGKVNSIRRAPVLTARCSRVVFWDMPGHGESKGRCTLGVKEPADLVALAERVGEGRPLVLCGSSMGTGVSIAAALQLSDAALVIVEAPYRQAPTPAANVMRFKGAPVRFNLGPALAYVGIAACGRWTGPQLSADRRLPFDRAVLAARLACPLLVFHGDADPTCPIEDGRAIAAASPQGRFVEIPGGTHQNLWTNEACRAIMEREYAAAIDAIARPHAAAAVGAGARSHDA
jgi:pimeloyl-ACP methyl ester carboxylesterase